MTENTCRFGDRREELLLDYLYDALDEPGHGEFESHLSACDACRVELDGLRTVRGQLTAWTPPLFNLQSSIFNQQPVASRPPSRWSAIPAWAQVAAAMLVLGVSAGIANLNVHYDASGLTIRTGWAAPTAAVPASASGAPWRADLTAFEQRLRTELQAEPAHATPAASTTAADGETLKRVRTLIAESERNQQRELALRVAEVMRDVDVQRRADLTRISQSLGQLQSNTGMEVMKQRQLLNYYVSLSQRQQ